MSEYNFGTTCDRKLPNTERRCPTHGWVANWIQVSQDGPHDGYYCQKCYVEKVIIPNCHKLTEGS